MIAGLRLGAVWYEGLTCWMPLRAVHADGRVVWAAEATRALSGMPLEQYVWAGGYRVVSVSGVAACVSVPCQGGGVNHHDLANAAQLAELQEWVAAAVGGEGPQPVGQTENESGGANSGPAVPDPVTSPPDHL